MSTRSVRRIDSPCIIPLTKCVGRSHAWTPPACLCGGLAVASHSHHSTCRTTQSKRLISGPQRWTRFGSPVPIAGNSTTAWQHGVSCNIAMPGSTLLIDPSTGRFGTGSRMRARALTSPHPNTTSLLNPRRRFFLPPSSTSHGGSSASLDCSGRRGRYVRPRSDEASDKGIDVICCTDHAALALLILLY